MKYIYKEELFINGALVDKTMKEWESDGMDDYEKINGLWRKLTENSNYHLEEEIDRRSMDLFYKQTIGGNSVIFNRILNTY